MPNLNLKDVILEHLANKKENDSSFTMTQYNRIQTIIEGEALTKILEKVGEDIGFLLSQTIEKVNANSPVTGPQFSQDCVRETIEKIAELEQEIYNDIFDGINGFRTLDID